METVNSFMPYLYCFLIAVIVIMLIRILIKLSGFSRTAGIRASKIEHINTKVDELNKSKEKIDYTVKNFHYLFPLAQYMLYSNLSRTITKRPIETIDQLQNLP